LIGLAGTSSVSHYPLCRDIRDQDDLRAIAGWALRIPILRKLETQSGLVEKAMPVSSYKDERILAN
jgi:hypothetical protein